MFVVAGDDSKTRVDIVELKEHPFFIGTQFRPEYTSQPLHPAPLFLGLILASAGSLVLSSLYMNQVTEECAIVIK
ncbi:3713_t:CDS:2, partial [Paraglomus occultum]